MAPQVGFEPTAYRLTAECSTTELLGNIIFTNFLNSQFFQLQLLCKSFYVNHHVLMTYIHFSLTKNKNWGKYETITLLGWLLLYNSKMFFVCQQFFIIFFKIFNLLITSFELLSNSLRLPLYYSAFLLLFQSLSSISLTLFCDTNAIV